ncbi:MAG: hypothetical protein ACI9F2_000520, partial [Lysobacterales bacterium]
RHNRLSVNFPIDLKVDSQITLEGKMKDISSKSAFIQMKSSIAMQINDQFDFQFNCTIDNEIEKISGTICISRIVKGEGIAVYFTKMDEESSARLKQLVG